MLATGEACNNVILHAAGDDFTVSIVVDRGGARVAVSDAGTGFEPPLRPAMPSPLATGRRGLALMEALVDVVEVTSDPGGTTVVLGQAFGLARPPALPGSFPGWTGALVADG